MTNTNKTNDQAETLQAKRDLDLENLTDWCEDIVGGLMAQIDDDALPESVRVVAEGARILFNHTALNEHRHTPMRRLSYLLMIDALLAAPEAATDVLRKLRAKLIEHEAALAIVSGDVEWYVVDNMLDAAVVLAPALEAGNAEA